MLNSELILAKENQELLNDKIIQQTIAILDSRLKVKGIEITGVEDAINYLRLQLELEEIEFFCVLFLDSKNRVIEFQKMFYGSIRSVEIHLCEIIKVVLALNASAIIIAHNHPSGKAEPGNMDCILTNKISNLLNLMDIHFIDHIIIGHNEYISFAEHGLLI
ncbi:JAB domain-containing protein [Photorhabdus bodei]|uniref:JAB domain-containing protein n=1 Tax=Photorhabdus bodei TaxID=2029681 RepID=A0AAW6BJQ7_9GAMM|nr:JAB domain-containing protein [Photorhabdus bodei]MDB6373889.1 JAB domain-containing protein [Photorhabdus bodei]